MQDVPELPAWLADLLPVRRAVSVLADGCRIHRIDHGEPDAPVVLLLHGNPTWSFLWRDVIARLSGFRCVAPDLLGFGLSSRIALHEHSVERHVDALAELVEALGLRRFVLVGQDWGGALGPVLAARLPERVAGVVLGNTSVVLPPRPRGTWFHRFARLPVVSDLAFRGLGFPQNALWVAQGDRRSIRGPVARGYRWPLRHLSDRSGPLALARMVPDSFEHPSIAPLRRGEAWLREFVAAGGPLALVWGERDPILGRALARHERAFSGASVTRTPAGHFLQEEVPEALAAAIRAVASRAGMR
ncbi:haloalkane dehalogenase [Nannocystis exedens]|uniref:Haloalkane dehalogenase n=1 Tax=Nannocystis exedens TaxID=54 RepID=A0A1I1VJE2_9BACT|nr:alpha/beta fold hydrolase [Nannocystis exedens]PCC72591.1 Haloalkane dehalogenase [Nannocystis exedens]SFD83126.1 haloalkane dehalogenase [Nannocystis exedens]